MNETARALLREIILNGGVMRPPADSQVAVVTLLTERRAVDVGRGFISVPDMRADTLVMARGLMLDLEINRPYDVPDGVPGWAGLLEPESRRSEVYVAAREWLMSMGLVRVDGHLLHDATGDAMRSSDRPRFVPDGWDEAARWEPVAVTTALAPLPTPSSTGHGASAPTPVELEPTAPKPARVVEKVAAPKPATVEKPAPAPVVKQPPTPVTPDITAAITRLAEASERQAEILSVAVSEGRLERSVRSETEAARDELARRICVMVAEAGQMRRGQITGGRLSKPQRKLADDAITYALGHGALTVAGGFYEIGDPTRIGWSQAGFLAAVEAQVEKKRRDAERRAAAAANRSIEQARDRVTGRAS